MNTFKRYLEIIFKNNLYSNEQHRAIVESFEEELKGLENNINLSKLEMSLEHSNEVWLELWGSYFQVYRKLKESDKSYRKRIIDSVRQPKSTIPAIKEGIANFLNLKYGKTYTKEDIFIREPFKNLSKYSHKGLLSKDSRFVSKDYYTHAIIDISIPEIITQDLKDYVNTLKAAGVKVFWSVLNQWEVLKEFSENNKIFTLFQTHLQTYSKQRLFSGLLLSNTSKKATLSGRQVIWTEFFSTYEMFLKSLRATKESITLSYKDLFEFLIESEFIELDLEEKSLLENLYKKLEFKPLSSRITIPSGTLEEYERLQTENSGKYSHFGTLSFTSVLYSNEYFKNLTKELIELYGTKEFELFKKLTEALKSYQSENEIFFSDLQSFILVGDIVKWFVRCSPKWVWELKTLSKKELFEALEDSPFKSLEEFESYYNSDEHWKSLGKDYQSSISLEEPFLWIIKSKNDWLFSSKTLQIKDLEPIFEMRTKKFNPKLKTLLNFDNKNSLTSRGKEQSEIS